MNRCRRPPSSRRGCRSGGPDRREAATRRGLWPGPAATSHQRRVQAHPDPPTRPRQKARPDRPEADETGEAQVASDAWTWSAACSVRSTPCGLRTASRWAASPVGPADRRSSSSGRHGDDAGAQSSPSIRRSDKARCERAHLGRPVGAADPAGPARRSSVPRGHQRAPRRDRAGHAPLAGRRRRVPSRLRHLRLRRPHHPRPGRPGLRSGRPPVGAARGPGNPHGSDGGVHARRLRPLAVRDPTASA